MPGAQTPSGNKIETKMLKWMLDVIMIEFVNYSDTRTEREIHNSNIGTCQ